MHSLKWKQVDKKGNSGKQNAEDLNEREKQRGRFLVENGKPDLKFLQRIISSVVDCRRKPRAIKISSVVDCRRKFGALGVTGDGSRDDVDEESGDFLEPRLSSLTTWEIIFSLITDSNFLFYANKLFMDI